jgi:hypothetical protein
LGVTAVPRQPAPRQAGRGDRRFELPVGQAESAFADDGQLLDPEQHAALTRLVDGLVARAGAQLAQAA